MNQLSELLGKLSGYAQIPAGIKAKYPEIKAKDDRRGALDRLKAIEFELSHTCLGSTVDLGGHSGFFCLSLLDSGHIKKARVYDHSPDALRAGRAMAKEMGIDNTIRFIHQRIGLDFVKRLKPADTIICMNLLHHAGSEFDQRLVAQLGWTEYALQFLTAMRERAKVAIFSVGFEPVKPKYWNVVKHERPERLAEIIRQAGWTIRYDANVRDIHNLGTRAANGRYTKGGLSHYFNPRPGLTRRALTKLRQVILRFGGREVANLIFGPDWLCKRQKYHLYLLERPE